jgi:hypothetical protein
MLQSVGIQGKSAIYNFEKGTDHGHERTHISRLFSQKVEHFLKILRECCRKLLSSPEILASEKKL